MENLASAGEVGGLTLVREGFYRLLNRVIYNIIDSPNTAGKPPTINARLTHVLQYCTCSNQYTRILHSYPLLLTCIATVNTFPR